MKNILSVEQPIKSTSSFGSWLVRYLDASPFGTRFIQRNAYFWSEKKALAWVSEVKSVTK